MYKIAAFFCLLSCHALGQQLKPGFDKKEYKELLHIFARTTADSSYFKNFPEPEHFKMIYQSKPIGLDNLWDLWLDENNTAVISLRGTTPKPESWLANFYAAMVPARGELKLDNEDTFSYELARDPKAAVHVGWLLSTAYLSRDILPRIDSLYKKDVKDFLIVGHSQGRSHFLPANLLLIPFTAGRRDSERHSFQNLLQRSSKTRQPLLCL
ncbi:MAG: hypothetical protein LRY55_13320 [Leadbetterella sp.]|nr:hypothetical protein [Leadbetterella sp.]